LCKYQLTPPGSRERGFPVFIRPFLLALGFLTRLAPPLPATEKELSASVLYYPLVGAVLGALLCTPLAFGLFAGQPWVQAWLYVLASIWLTRALHLDGLADLADALGSGKAGDAFRAVLKDSRIGAFGVTALALIVSGQIIFCASILLAGNSAPLFFAPLYGRCLPVIFAAFTPPHPQAGLGSLVSSAAKKPALLLAAACIVIGGSVCLSLPSLFLCLFLTALALLFLNRLARREGGASGDFFGCVIVAGETIALLAAL